MDMLGNEQWRANLRYEGRFGWGALEARVWHEDVEHFMDFGADKRFWYGADSGEPSANSADRRRTLRATPYYTRVTDYIDAVRCPASLGGACATQTPGGNKFVFLQFANQSARLYGVDLSGRTPLADTSVGEFGLEGVASYTDGENLDSGDNLYNIMPPNATLTLTHKLGGWGAALEWVVVKAKSNVSAVRNEVPTPGYGLLNLRAGYAWPKLRLDFGVENLLDKFYTPPLGGAYLGQGTTMTTSPVGSVPRWGLAVPGMGRSIYAGVIVSF